MSAGQLPSLAAAHPEAYTALIEVYLRSPIMHAADIVAATGFFQYAAAAVLDSDVVLGNTVAAASLASVVNTLVKRAVQYVGAASSMQQQQHELVTEDVYIAAACYPAVVYELVRYSLESCCSGVWEAAKRIWKRNNPISSISSSQAAASAALLAVVLARSLVQLADAMEAAGPQLLFDLKRAQPRYTFMWAPGGQVQGVLSCHMMPAGSADQQDAKSLWQLWQLYVLQAMQPLRYAMHVFGMVELAGDAETPAAAAAGRPP
jgi:hypothetical protein